MERNSGDGMDPRSLTEGLSLVTATWESELASKRLSEADIDAQSSADPADSLTRLDDLLEDPRLLSPLWIDMSGESPTAFTDEKSAPNQAIEVTPESLVRGRRAQILRRSKLANEAAKAELFHELDENSLDDVEMQSIEDKLERLDVEEGHLDELRNEGNALDARRTFERQMERQQFEANLEESRRRFDLVAEKTRAGLRSQWRSRESIAAIVGGALLISFAITAIVAMFTGTEITDVVQNSFLLILGYFFGAAVGRRPDGANDQDAPRARTP